MKSNVIDIHLSIVSELECALSILFSVRIRLVDLRIFRKFTISFDCAEGGKVLNEEGGYMKERDLRLRASSAVYFTITSAFPSWNSRSDKSTISPWLIQTCSKIFGKKSDEITAWETRCQILTFFLILPRICANRFSPSKHWASNRPFPSILMTWAYSETKKNQHIIDNIHNDLTLAIFAEN